MVADRLEHGCWQFWTLGSLNRVADGLEYCCWHACSWMLEQTVHGERTDLNIKVVGTIVINQSCMIEHVVRELWSNKIEQRCYNNHELGCCINQDLDFVCSNRYANNSKLYTICWNMIEQYTVIFPILFYNVNSAVTWEKQALLPGMVHLDKSPGLTTFISPQNPES